MRPIVLRPVVTDTLAVLLVLAAALAVILHTYGCTPKDAPPPVIYTAVENAAVKVQYSRLLDACKALGKDAGSFAVYEVCAARVDADLCAANRLLCDDAGAP